MIRRAVIRKTWHANRKQNATSRLPNTSVITRFSPWHGFGGNSRALRISAAEWTDQSVAVCAQRFGIFEGRPLQNIPIDLYSLKLIDFYLLFWSAQQSLICSE